MLRILHVSDLHVRENWAKDQRVILDGLLRDLTAIHDDRPVDLVIFSGDLTFSAQERQFELAKEIFLEPLRDLLRLPVSRIILAPGNHDIDRSQINPYAEAGLKSALSDRDQVNKLIDDPGELGRQTERMNPWREFYQRYTGEPFTCDGISLAKVHTLNIEGLSVGIAVVSSCWRATGAGDDEDRKRLLVGDRQLRTALSSIQEAKIRLAVMHHPLDWLVDFDMRSTSLMLRRQADILFNGHVHYADPQGVTASTGDLIQSQAGSLYQWRDYTNSYSVIDIDEIDGTAAVTMRTYFDERESFAEAVNIAPQGRVVFNLPNFQVQGAELGVRRNADGAASHGKELDSERSDDAALALVHLVRETSVLAGRLPGDSTQMDDLLVPPSLLPMPVEQYNVAVDPDTGRRPDRANPVEDLRNNRCLVVVGEESSGLSSALAWHAYESYRIDVHLSPVLIDFRNFPAGHDPVGKTVRTSLAQQGIVVKLKEELPPLALAVDNVNSRPPAHLNRLVARVASGVNDQFILGCHPTEEASLSQKLIDAGVDFVVRYIGPFGRRELRQFVERVEPTRVNEITSAILALLSREGLPRTPFMIAALVSIVTEDTRWAIAGTETAVLDAYVGMLLGRGDTSDDSRIDLDYRDREHILSSLAEELVRKEKAGLPRLDAEDFLISYFRGLGWSVPPGAVIDNLIERRVLRQRGNLLEFRQNALLFFFAARRLLESDTFREFVLDDPLWHAAAIRHAAALRRSDEAFLAYADSLLEGAIASLPSNGNELFTLATNEDGWADPETFGGGAAEASFSDAVEPDEASEDGALGFPADDIFDDLLDQLDVSALIQVQELFPPRRELGSAEHLRQTLNLASSILRSSELVTNLPLKDLVLRRVLKGFADLSALYAANEDFMSLTKRIITAFFEVVESEREKSDRLIDRTMLLAPVAVSYTGITESLTSLKLVEILKGVVDDPEFLAEGGQALMAFLLAADIGVADWTRVLTIVLRQHGDKRVVRETVYFIARVSYYEKQSPFDVAVLQEIMAESIVSDYKHRDEKSRKIFKDGILNQLRSGRKREIGQRRAADSVDDGQDWN